MNKGNIEQQIKENWFKHHKATLTQHGDLQVLEWKNPKEIYYLVRYVFDGRKIYISGDIGEAVFWLTWKAEIHSFNDINIDYFEEKLQAYSSDRRDFDTDEAVERIKEWENELKEDDKEFDEEMMADLIKDASNCSGKDEWAYEFVNGRYSDFIQELDIDYWEWFYSIGDVIPMRVNGYLIGLKMASEQLGLVKP